MYAISYLGVTPEPGAVIPPEMLALAEQHIAAVAAADDGRDGPSVPTPDDMCDALVAALGTRTADVQAEVDAECDEAPDAITVPSVAALRTGATVRVAARRAIEAIAAQTGEHAWQVAVRMRRRQIAAQKVAAVPVRDLPDGEVMP